MKDKGVTVLTSRPSVSLGRLQPTQRDRPIPTISCDHQQIDCRPNWKEAKEVDVNMLVKQQKNCLIIIIILF